MSEPKALCLALQGGGAHGGFTWGVLDRLLEDERIQLEAVSGCSAGAMNAAVLAQGLNAGGRDGAREALKTFWRAVSDAARASPFQRTPLQMLMGEWSLDASPGYLMMDIVGRIASPYDLNPLGVNPLLDLIGQLVDFEQVRSCPNLKLYISATNVETGRVRVFENDEITAKVVMASACLPFMFQAVEIDGAPYWDGGYVGNPVLFPFFRSCGSRDVAVVAINPLVRHGTPKAARDILNRVNEITFNNSLIKELRAIDFVSRMLEEHRLDDAQYKEILVHMISDDRISSLGASSKLNAEWGFLTHLFDIGREAADAWLDAHYDDLGKRATIKLRGLFQTKRNEDEATPEMRPNALKG